MKKTKPSSSRSPRTSSQKKNYKNKRKSQKNQKKNTSFPRTLHSPETLHSGFCGLLITQFLGAMNDNILKQFLLLAIALGGIWEEYNGYKGAINVLFALPFILGSAFFGQFADKKSKQWIALHMKNLEIVLALLTGIFIYYGNFFGALLGLFLFSAQSTIFGPAKYGMIPELVRYEKISSSNGLISMTTNLAVLLGVACGGAVCLKYHSQLPSMSLWVMLVVAALGRISVVWIPPLEPKDPQLKYNYNFFSFYHSIFKDMRKINKMVTCSVAWGYFYFCGATTLQCVSDFGKPLEIDETSTTLLTAMIAISIGLGSSLAAFVSRKGISIRSLKIGGYGMSFTYLCYFALPPHFYLHLFFIAILGVFAGLHVVPIISFIQSKAPDNKRGQYLGANNFFSFIMIACAGFYDTLLNLTLYTASPFRKMAICGIISLFLMVTFIGKIRPSDVATPQ
jgi:predicted MFS family arabinose efflux permease